MSKFGDAALTSKSEVTSAPDQSWTSRALDGFLESGKQAIAHPVDTAAGLAAGGVIGAGVQKTLDVAEKMGGRVAVAAEVAKVALVVGPLAYSGYKITTAEDSARETGKTIFNTGLFLGSAGLGASSIARTSFDRAGSMTAAEFPALQMRQNLHLIPFQMPNGLNGTAFSDKNR